MKTNLLKTVFLFAFTIVIQTHSLVFAQLQCTGNTVMYAVFNDTATAGLKQSAVYPVTYSNGNIGTRMGNQFLVNSPSGAVKGTASLAVSMFTNYFYYMTSMSSTTPEDKDVYAFNYITNTHTKIATTPATLSSYHFVKLTVHPNGSIYGLGVHRQSNNVNYQVLVRIASCGAVPTTNCSTVEILGYIPNSVVTSGVMFNGDMAFNMNGDMYIAVTSATSPVEARLYRISNANMPTVAGTGTIQTDFMYDLNPLDNTQLNGVAFDVSGRFFISTNRTITGGLRQSELWQVINAGSITKINTFGTVPAENIITDLGSCVYPGGVLSDATLKLDGSLFNSNAKLNWITENKNVSHFEIEQRNNEDFGYRSIARIEATADTKLYNKIQSLTVNDGPNVHYRIKQVDKTGNISFSNTISLRIPTVGVMFSFSPNPFVENANVLISKGQKGTALMKLIDITGTVIWQQRINLTGVEQTVNINNLSAIPKGHYVFQLQHSNGQVYNQKVIHK